MAMNHRLTECQACHAPIKFIKLSLTRRYNPVDADPVAVRPKTGGYSYILPDGRFIFGEKVGDACDDPEIVEAFESHFATCPYGGKFRKPRDRSKKLREQESGGGLEQA